MFVDIDVACTIRIHCKGSTMEHTLPHFNSWRDFRDQPVFHHRDFDSHWYEDQDLTVYAPVEEDPC